MPKIQITELDKEPQAYSIDLSSELVNLGRAEGNHILLSCPSTSSNHCSIKRVQGGYVVEDNGSTNGVKMGGTQHSVITLKQSL